MSTEGRTAERRPGPSYKAPIPRTWWMKNRRYTIFFLREASAVFIALFAVLYIVQFALLASGPAPYGRFLDFIAAPAWIALHVVILVFAVIHTLTWFNLMPAVSPLRLRGKEAPRKAMWLGAVIGWLIVSVAVGFLLVRG